MASKKLMNKSKKLERQPKKNLATTKSKKSSRFNVKIKNSDRKIVKVGKNISKNLNKVLPKKVSNTLTKVTVKKADRSRKTKKNDVSLKILTPEMVESLKRDTVFTDYVNGKIGKRADEIILSLAAPMTDEALAEKLEMKINDTRRVLNMLNTDGVARYIVNKNNKGWLTFKWYIDEDNLKKMRGEVVIKAVTNNSILPDNCNDFYICAKCYSKAKLVYPFEVGYEMSFKCGECGSFFERKSKEDIEKMLF